MRTRFLRPPINWELTLDPQAKRWDTRTPSGDPLLDEAGMFLLDETGIVVLEAE